MDFMSNQRTMANYSSTLQRVTENAIVIPAILAENFELKHGLLNLVTSKQFYGFEKEDPHAHIRWFNKITSTIKYRDVPNSSIKLMRFPFSIEGAARIWLEKEPAYSILTWKDLCMPTRSSSNLVGETSTNPKRRNRRRSRQIVKPFSLEENPVVTMADQRTMAELLQAPTEGYRDAIVIPAILAENFELKHGLLNLVTSKQFYGFEKEDPHAHIRWFNKITSTIKYRDVPNSSIKLMLFPFSIEGAARIWLEKEPPHSILTWKDLAWHRFKDLLRACPHHGFTELHKLDTFYNALTPTDQDSLNAAAGGNLLTKTPRDALTIIENKSKVRNSRNKPIVTKVSTNAPSSSTPHSLEIAALVDAVKAMLHQKSSPLLS
ncbi:hypothetical protein Tco_0657939 [Tanacetum coccineum]